MTRTDHLPPIVARPRRSLAQSLGAVLLRLARCWIATLALAAHAAEPTIPAAALQSDARILRQAWQDLHPGLYRYSTPAQVRRRFELLERRFATPLPRRDAFLALSELAATLRCGHTFLNPTNQSREVQLALFEAGRNRLPFEFVWRDGRMLVTRDLTPDGQVPRGSRIESVEGIPTQRILQTLMRIARADGGNDAKRVDLLQVQGTERYETFDVYFPLYFRNVDDELEISLRTSDGRRLARRVRGLGYADRIARRHGAGAAKHAGWAFEMTDPRLAILRMPTWALYDADWDWKAWLGEVFATLAQHPRDALVLDLRGNEGGLDVGDELLPYLIAAPLAVDDPPRFVRYRTVPPALAPVLDTWDPSFKDWGEDARDAGDRFFAMPYFSLLDETGKNGGRAWLQPKTPRFPGRVFVLIDASNSSATFQFAQRVKQTGIATLVGQTTGGNLRGINGGAFFFLRLPGSGLELDLPLIARFPRDGSGLPPDAGVAPDVAVIATPDAIAEGRDLHVERVRQLLGARTASDLPNHVRD